MGDRQLGREARTFWMADEENSSEEILVKKLGVLEVANHARTDTNHFWVRQAPVVVVVR